MFPAVCPLESPEVGAALTRQVGLVLALVLGWVL